MTFFDAILSEEFEKIAALVAYFRRLVDAVNACTHLD